MEHQFSVLVTDTNASDLTISDPARVVGDALSSIIYAGGSPADRQAERIVSQYFRDTFAPTVALPGGQHAKRMRVLASGMLYHDCFTSMVSGVAALLTLPEGDPTITEWCEALQKLLPQHVDGDLPEHSAMDAYMLVIGSFWG